MSTSKSPAPTRRKSTSVSAQETQAALDVLVGAMTEDFVSPAKAIAPSAVQLIVRSGITDRPSRASYILELLVQAQAIERIDGSRSYLVLRKSVAVGRTPVMPAADQAAYEETIRRLNAQLDAERAAHETEIGKVKLDLMQAQDRLVKANQFVNQLEAVNAEQAEQLAKLETPVTPSSDVRTIMDRVLGS